MGILRIDRLTGPPAPLTVEGGPVLASRCHLADRPLARAVGLLGTPDPAPGEALWITRCGAVHAWFLRARIGVAFLDGHGRVLRVVDPLPRWHAARCPGAHHTVEAPRGVLAGLRPGEVLTLG
ncbi:MAG: DUF192 domain-containing protein [Thermoleophilia bacterium]|nr:DUF192 domain-containing protein [Thermoleophilia bacterium]